MLELNNLCFLGEEVVFKVFVVEGFKGLAAFMGFKGSGFSV